MAAEAAFAGPSISVIHNGQTKITVRRTRVVTRTEQQPQILQPQTDEPQRKGPRIFRLEGPQLKAEPPPVTSLHSFVAQRADAHPQPRVSRKRRAADKRPGPLVLVVQRPTASPPPPPPPSPSPTPAVPLEPKSRTLATRLSRVAPVLCAIEQARSLQFVDERWDAQYLRLSRQADELLRQLRGRRR